jgi:hypothetical protein
VETVRTGSCGCGAVRFTTRGKLRGIVYCHCGQCRRQTGHFYAATAVWASGLHVEGGDLVTWYQGSPEARRGFCSRCGSALFWRREGAETVSILAGAFDLPSGLEGSHHIFADQKGDYYEIADGLPQNSQG